MGTVAATDAFDLFDLTIIPGQKQCRIGGKSFYCLTGLNAPDAVLVIDAAASPAAACKCGLKRVPVFGFGSRILV